MKKSLFSSLLCLAIVFSAFSITALASSYWYDITTPNSYGSSVSLTAANKEYTQVAVNTSDKSSVTVKLYQSSTWYGDDQTLSYGSNKRAWWYGNTTGNKSYKIYASSNANEMSLSGYFQNYQ